MKEVILGIKDYMKDIRHDRACTNPYLMWKEGSVWHYIRQRRIAKKALKESK